MSEVWCKGDNCLAPWSSDGKLYEGLVRKIIRRPNGQVIAKVRYHGFGPEEEEVEISKLQKSPILHIGNKPKKLTASELNSGIFRPLTGNEEEKRIREKFSRLEAEENEIKERKCRDSSLPQTAATAQRRKKRSYGPIFDSQEPSTSRGPVPRKSCKGTGVGKHSTSSKTELTGKRSPATRGNSARATVSKINDDAQTSSSTGFTDEDMEKPKFAFPAVTAKVQFKLCEEEPVYAIPGSINQYLRDYQRDGVKFLYENYRQKTGAILGDDMGLGKTVQVIGFLSALLRKWGNREDVMRLKPKFIRELSDTARVDDSAIHKPFLIIGPGSVLYNWLDELETWGYFTARKYHGSDKSQTLADVKKGKVEIVVTTYETFRDNLDELNSVKWCAVIVDEVHRIKGLTSQTTAALRKIHTPCRFGLTGTALQNNVTELWSILDWARPGFLGNLKSFETEFVKRIERGQKHDATKRELAEARKMKEKFSSLRNKMMLRRTKKLIADQLPEKDDNIVFSKLTSLQVDVYKAILNHPDMKLILSMEDPCQCGSQKPQVKCCHQTTSDGTPVRNLMFTYMSLLMKTANHVALLIPDKTTSEGQRKHAKEICEIAFAKHPQFVSQASEASFRTLSDPKYCGKMKILKGLLSVFRKKHNKVLLFSYSTKLLSIVEQYVISVGYEYRRIDGSVTSKKRMDIVREFNNDKNIFICLISTKAGGLGLNLTGANVVIIFDPNWNPSYDLQAQDRAYRIGQRRNVQVFRLVSAGTIEENIYLRQVYKQQLDTVAVEMGNAKRYFHGIQGDKHNKGELFGLKNMFKLQTGEHCLTMDILKRNEKLEAGLKTFDIVEYLPCSNAAEESDSGEITDGAGGQSSEDSSDEFGGLMDMFLDEESKEDGEERTVRSKEENVAKTVANIHARTHRDEENSVPEDAIAGTLRGDNSNVSEPTSSTSEHGLQSRQSKSKGKGPGKRKAVQFVDAGESLLGSYGSVTEVLDHCDVLHVHKNPQVVGSSRAEDHMSRCAIQDVFELHLNSQIPAVQCPPLSQSSDSDDSDTVQKKPAGTKAKASKSHGPSYNQSCVRSIGSTRVLIGQTPKTIKREHFEKLSAFMNCSSLTDFAEKVLTMSVTQRVELLNSFYHRQQQELFPLFTVETVPEHKTKTSRSVKEKASELTPSKWTQKKQPKARKTPMKLGLHYNSSEESYTCEAPANMIGEPDTPIPSTSYHHGNQSHSHELIVGAKRLPRRSPAQRKAVKTRPRKRKQPVPDANMLSGFEDISPNKSLLESRTCETGNAAVRTFTRTCESIPVDNLLEEMISAQPNEIVDPEDDVEVKIDSEPTLRRESASNKFALLDDIFLTEKETSPPKRKPPPSSASRKQKKGSQSEVRTETVTKQTMCDSPSVDNQLNPSRDLFDSLQGTPEETLKTKEFGIFGDASKWRRRDRKRGCPKKTKTVSEKVDKLISEGNEEYAALFVSGKMRKLSRSKQEQESEQQEGEGILSSCEEPDGVITPSLFSGR